MKKVELRETECNLVENLVLAEVARLESGANRANLHNLIKDYKEIAQKLRREVL